jgi:acetone carboxylase gamma subunit
MTSPDPDNITPRRVIYCSCGGAYRARTHRIGLGGRIIDVNPDDAIREGHPAGDGHWLVGVE